MNPRFLKSLLSSILRPRIESWTELNTKPIGKTALSANR